MMKGPKEEMKEEKKEKMEQEMKEKMKEKMKEVMEQEQCMIEEFKVRLNNRRPTREK